jgi:hypothetical protein
MSEDSTPKKKRTRKPKAEKVTELDIIAEATARIQEDIEIQALLDQVQAEAAKQLEAPSQEDAAKAAKVHEVALEVYAAETIEDPTTPDELILKHSNSPRETARAREALKKRKAVAIGEDGHLIITNRDLARDGVKYIERVYGPKARVIQP